MATDDALKPNWYSRPSVIIILLFFVLGPLGLPLLFRSPAFGKTWKIALTLAVIVYTAYLVYVSVKIGTGLFETTFREPGQSFFLK